MKVCQCRFIRCDRCTPLLGDADPGGGGGVAAAGGGGGGGGGGSVSEKGAEGIGTLYLPPGLL